MRATPVVDAAAIALVVGLCSAGAAVARPGTESVAGAGATTAVAQDQPVDPELYDEALLREVAVVFEDADWRQRLERMDPANPVDLAASLTVDGTTLERVGVRYKGNTSQRVDSGKKPFNIKTQSFVDGQRLWGYDVINLNNAASDPSMVREILGYGLLRPYMPVPRSSFARVSVQGSYLGVYTMVEQINREMVAAWFPSDGGIVIKGDPPTGARLETSALQYLGETTSPYEAVYEVKTAGSEQAGYEHLRDLARALSATPAQGGLSDAMFPEGIRRVLDVEHALWYLAGSNLLQNGDSYYAGHNYYLYETRDEPRFQMLHWDLNMSFGVFPIGGMMGPGRPGQPGRPPGGGTDLAVQSPFTGEDMRNRPLIRRLLAVPGYRADYVAHLRTLRDEAFTPDLVEQAAVAFQDLIRASVVQEPDPIFSFSLFERNLREDVSAGSSSGPGTAAPGVLKLAADRNAYLLALPELKSPRVQLDDHALIPPEPTASDDVVASAAFAGLDEVVAAEIRYRVDRGVELVVDMVPTGRGTWRGTIPAQREGRDVTYVIRGELADGRAVFFPPRTLTEPFAYQVLGADLPYAEAGDLVVNELMADNETTIADEAGEFDDWLELYNRGTDAIQLSGYFLSDDPADPFAFALPEGELAPGAHLLIWCDNDPEQGPFHAPFALSRDGESAVLSTTDAILDQVDFGAQETDLSYARAQDGGEPWQICDTPSPGEANRCGEAPPTATAQPATGTPSTTVTPASATPIATLESPTPTPSPAASATAATPTPGNTPGAWTVLLPLANR